MGVYIKSMSGVLSKTNFQFGENNFEVIVFERDDDENKSYFIAQRVVKALGFVDTTDAVRNHCPNRIEYQSLVKRPGGRPGLLSQPKTNLIPEACEKFLTFLS